MEDTPAPPKPLSKARLQRITNIVGSVHSQLNMLDRIEALALSSDRRYGAEEREGELFGRLTRIANHLEKNPRDLVAHFRRGFLEHRLWPKKFMNEPRKWTEEEIEEARVLSQAAKEPFEDLEEANTLHLQDSSELAS